MVMMTVALVMVMLVIVVQLVMAMEALVMVGVTEEPNRAYCSLSLDGFFTGRAFSHCISPDPAIARLHCVLRGSSLSYKVRRHC